MNENNIVQFLYNIRKFDILRVSKPRYVITNWYEVTIKCQIKILKYPEKKYKYNRYNSKCCSNLLKPTTLK